MAVYSDNAESILADLTDAPVIRFSMGNEASLHSGLEAYISAVQPIANQLKMNWDDLAAESLQPRQVGKVPVKGTLLERRVGERLLRAGAFVDTNVVVEDGVTVDGLATFPTLGNPLNPVVLELKARRQVPVDLIIQQDLEQLRKSMKKIDARLGILVYDKAPPPKLAKSVIEDRRGILITSVDELELWSDQEIVATLTKLRNRIVHAI